MAARPAGIPAGGIAVGAVPIDGGMPEPVPPMRPADAPIARPGRHERVESEPSPAGSRIDPGPGGPADDASGDRDIRPPLPRRRRMAHLAYQLHLPPIARGEEEAAADHDPGLMASFMRGVHRAEAGLNEEQGRHDRDDGAN